MSTPIALYLRSPLLCLLDCYVLWTIDELGDEQASILSEMTPNLRRVYHAGGEWHDVIAVAMRWGNGMPRKIRAAWAKKPRTVHGGHAAADAFAVAYVDAHFASPRPVTPTHLRPGSPFHAGTRQKPKLEIV